MPTSRDVVRLQVRVHPDDAALIRSIVGALADPKRQEKARALLRFHFAGSQANGLKMLLASAPLEGIDLTRTSDR